MLPFCVNQESIVEVGNTDKRFCSVSGSPANGGKCLSFWHGNCLRPLMFYENVKGLTTFVKYLGVPLENYWDSEPFWRGHVAEPREKAEKTGGWHFWISSRAKFATFFFFVTELC